MFFQGCFAAGQSTCALVHQGDSSWLDVKRRVWEWVDNLDEYPIVAGLADGNRVFITGGGVRTLFVQSVYTPLVTYQALAVALEDAMQGNTTSLSSQYTSQLDPPLGNLSNYSNHPILPMDGMAAVNCADGVDVSDKDNSFWRQLLQNHMAISSVSGSFWAAARITCAGWPARPGWILRGPFTTPEPTERGQALDPERPAAPILFASNRYDPATPLESARLMMKNHPGAGLLLQEAAGHCVLSTDMLPCSKDAFANYFDTGAVPDGELVCETGRGPWDTEPEA